MVADAPGVTHAAGGDDDMEALEPGNALAVLDAFGRVQQRRGEQIAHMGTELRRVAAEHLRRPDCQGGIKKERRGGDIAVGHEPDEVDDQFLRPLDREGRDEQRAARGLRCFYLGGKVAAPALGGDRRTVCAAIGRLAQDVIKSGRPLRITLQQFGVRTDVAGGENAQRTVPGLCVGKFHFDRRRAEQMPGVPVTHAQARQHLDPGLVGDGPEELLRRDGIALRVDRRHFRAAAVDVAPVERRHFRFLDAAAVGQHE